MSNGIIDRAVGLVIGQARTLKAALERRIGTRVPPDARTLCWLVEFAAYLMNRCDIGSDGKRLYERKDNTNLGIRREDLVHASQASKREKVGAEIPSGSVHPESEPQKKIVLGHRARLDTTPFSLIRRIISIRCTTQHHHKH